MKKLFVLLGILCALCFLACSNFQLAGGDMGVVSLAIGDELASEIRSAAGSRSIASGTSYTVTGVLSGEYSAESSVTVDSGALAGATISFGDVPVGISITLNLSVQAGNNLLWIGNSETHVVAAGENLLTIAIGRVSGVLMWSVDGTEITPYGNYDTPSIKIDQTQPVWCFDNKGDLYVLDAVNDAIIPYSLKADGTYTSLAGTGWSTGDIPSFLSYDNASGVLYGMRETEIVYLNAKDSSWEVKGELNSDGSSYFGFAVNNNISYIAEQSGEWGDNRIPLVTVKSYDLTLDGEDIKGSEKIGNEINLPASFGSSPTGQMIYQEGFLYLLLSAFAVTSNESDKTQHSCGAIVKINPQTLAIDTSFGSGGFLGLAEGRESSVSYSGAIYNPILYAPTESNVKTTFCGPAGFVAVMPKKLVIGDAGYILSDNGDEGLLAKRKSRIITVDLETQAFDIMDLSNPNCYENTASSSGFLTVE